MHYKGTLSVSGAERDCSSHRLSATDHQLPQADQRLPLTEEFKKIEEVTECKDENELKDTDSRAFFGTLGE